MHCWLPAESTAYPAIHSPLLTLGHVAAVTMRISTTTVVVALVVTAAARLPVTDSFQEGIERETPSPPAGSSKDNIKAGKGWLKPAARAVGNAVIRARNVLPLGVDKAKNAVAVNSHEQETEDQEKDEFVKEDGEDGVDFSAEEIEWALELEEMDEKKEKQVPLNQDNRGEDEDEDEEDFEDEDADDADHDYDEEDEEEYDEDEAEGEEDEEEEGDVDDENHEDDEYYDDDDGDDEDDEDQAETSPSDMAEESSVVGVAPSLTSAVKQSAPAGAATSTVATTGTITSPQ